MTYKSKFGLLSVCWVVALLAPSPAHADKPVQSTQSAQSAKSAQPAKATRPNRVLTMSEVTIVGRVQKPIAAVDVSRIPARLTMNRHDQKLLPKIQRALYRAPF